MNVPLVVMRSAHTRTASSTQLFMVHKSHVTATNEALATSFFTYQRCHFFSDEDETTGVLNVPPDRVLPFAFPVVPDDDLLVRTLPEQNNLESQNCQKSH